jgi:hypothetical protein
MLSRAMFVAAALSALATWGGSARAELTTAHELDGLEKWLAAHRVEAACSEHCFVLEKLALAGDAEKGALSFELSGVTLAKGAVDIPLFGPPDAVRLDGVTENEKPAAIGFEGDHYFLHTSARRFLLRAKLALEGDHVLAVPGPLNQLEARLTRGRLVEGDKLSGVTGATLHFDSGDSERPLAEPTVFQLSRAIRVAREITFEYHLTMRSGADLGVVRLPLHFGERVLDVQGSPGWKVEGEVLTLPTSGHTAQMTVTGALPTQTSMKFAGDDRAQYEWWLIESDPEHRVTVGGEGKPLDPAESPIARTQATSRLFLLQKGAHVDVAVAPLVSADVLAAVVRSHARTAVLTRRGDLVMDDWLNYENNGIDYLMYSPQGQAIFLSTDGAAERIMHRDVGMDEMFVPLRGGSHSVRVQALAQSPIKTFGGAMEIPMPTYPLATSTSRLTLGLPAHVHPVAMIGGDKPEWFVHARDLLAIAAGFVVAFLAFRTRARRVLGGLVLAGTWVFSEPLFMLVVGAAALGGGIWVLGRFFRGKKLLLASVPLLFTALLAYGTTLRASHSSPTLVTVDNKDLDEAGGWENNVRVDAPLQETQTSQVAQRGTTGLVGGQGQAHARAAAAPQAGILQGVTPVALTLPGYQRQIAISRELVTRERPFHPKLYYVTDWAIWPVLLAWLACTALLLRSHRVELRELARRIRERLARRPELGLVQATTRAGEGPRAEHAEA